MAMSKERELLRRWLIDFGKVHPDVELMKNTQELLAKPERNLAEYQRGYSTAVLDLKRKTENIFIGMGYE